MRDLRKLVSATTVVAISATLAAPAVSSAQAPARGLLPGTELPIVGGVPDPGALLASLGDLTPAQLNSTLGGLTSAQLTELLGPLDAAQLTGILGTLAPADLAELLGGDLSPAQLSALLDGLTPAQLTALLGDIAPADLADLLDVAGLLQVVAGDLLLALTGSGAGPAELDAVLTTLQGLLAGGLPATSADLAALTALVEGLTAAIGGPPVGAADLAALDGLLDTLEGLLTSAGGTLGVELSPLTGATTTLRSTVTGLAGGGATGGAGTDGGSTDGGSTGGGTTTGDGTTPSAGGSTASGGSTPTPPATAKGTTAGGASTGRVATTKAIAASAQRAAVKRVRVKGRRASVLLRCPASSPRGCAVTLTVTGARRATAVYLAPGASATSKVALRKAMAGRKVTAKASTLLVGGGSASARKSLRVAGAKVRR